MSTYATLGPPGTNHDLVLRTYLQAKSNDTTIELYDDFDAALAACAAGQATHLVICAAHPDVGRIVSAAQYAHGILLIDSFIAESQPLAILTGKGIPNPRTIALHPATREYADLSQYQTVHQVASTVAAYEGLQQGRWDSALTAARFASEADVVITTRIAPPRDAWLILGRTGDTTPVMSIHNHEW